MDEATREGSRFAAASAGERWALEELLDLCGRFARHVCGGVGAKWSADVDPEDLAQEAATRLFTRGLEQFSGQGTEESYVYTLVRSTMLMKVRSADRRRKREEGASDPDAVQAPDSHAALEVESLLAQIDEACRDLLRRVFLLEVSYPVLAADLGLAESSVRAQVSRCVKKARQHV